MKTFRDMPIRRKLMLSILSTSVVVMLLMLGTFFTYEFFALRLGTVRQLSTLGEITADNATAALAFQNQQDADEILHGLKAQRYLVAAAIYDQSGQLFSRYPKTLKTKDLPSAPGDPGYRYGESHLAGFQPMMQKDRRLGTLYLEMDGGAALRDRLLGLFKIALPVMALILLVAYLLAHALEKQISRPILALAETANDITERQDFSARAEKHGRDEIGQLTDGLNEMLAGIQQRESALDGANDALRAENAERKRGEQALQIAMDDLERKVTERTAELRSAKEQAESSDRLKSEFLANMSHELRTPMNAIIGFTGTLMMKLPGPLTQAQEKQLSTVQSSARHLLSLINDLLDVAKIESGKVELKFEPVSCTSIIEEMAAVLRPLAEKKGLEFQIQLPTEDIVILTDRRALNQIIINLANNAIKFTEVGRIIIAAARRQKSGDTVTELSFSDTGCGIQPEDQNRLFQAFSQLDSSSTRRYEGTGLGLHLSQKLAELLGARITFHSEFGKGSTFTLTIREA
jgi:signal transduction histidine kinase